MRVAPSQQVSVNPVLQGGQSGMSGLASKIDELLRSQKASKLKKAQAKAYSGAKKQYREYRKKAVANIKAQNKEIKKRENAKIKKLPVKQRAAARKKLKEVLKARENKVKKQLPSKIDTPGQLRQLMASFRTLKV